MLTRIFAIFAFLAEHWKITVSQRINFSQLAPTSTAAPNQCFFNEEAFATNCDQVLNGVADGGRCFFTGDTITTWTLAWEVCRQHGAVLAQVHTTSEYQALLQYPKIRNGPVWVALKRTGAVPTQAQSITMDTTFWYNNETDPDPAMKVGNTWLRTHAQYDQGGTGDPTENCIGMGYVQGYTGILFFDDFCYGQWYQYHPLCQYSKGAQNYNKTDICLFESPIDVMPGQNPNECADACSSKAWCRSFNFHCDSHMCEFFTWSAFDQNANVTSAQGTSCHHYNYIP